MSKNDEAIEALDWIYNRVNPACEMREGIGVATHIKHMVSAKLDVIRAELTAQSVCLSNNPKNDKQSTLSVEDERQQSKPVDVEALKKQIGEELSDDWGGNILQRIQMAINFAVEFMLERRNKRIKRKKN